MYKFYPIIIQNFRASYIFTHLRTMSFFNLARNCCAALQASCLACELGISVEEYCRDHPLMLGCEKGNIYKMINQLLVGFLNRWNHYRIYHKSFCSLEPNPPINVICKSDADCMKPEDICIFQIVGIPPPFGHCVPRHGKLLILCFIFLSHIISIEEIFLITNWFILFHYSVY